MWCTSSVSFSQRTRTRLPVCSDESSSQGAVEIEKATRLTSSGSTAGRRVGSNMAEKNKGQFEEILDIHMSFLSISSGYYFSRWKRLRQVCNDTSMISNWWFLNLFAHLNHWHYDARHVMKPGIALRCLVMLHSFPHFNYRYGSLDNSR